jgi:superfamily II DNA helicase RecQ
VQGFDGSTEGPRTHGGLLPIEGGLRRARWGVICGFFHAGNRDNPEGLRKWLTEGGMMVATTALGTGMGYPGVMLVVHVGLPYGLIDFSQESGRASRGGE